MDAHDLSALAVKARVLLDWCERDRDDVVSQLTMSLCRDVLRTNQVGQRPINARVVVDSARALDAQAGLRH